MDRFTIRDIENLTQIKAHTWRIWEQRYGISPGQRPDGKHRLYNNEDLKHVLKISSLYHGGCRISRIAKMSDEEITEQALADWRFKSRNERLVAELLHAALDFDADRFGGRIDEAINLLGVEKAVVSVIYPFQERIGVLWLTSHLVPAQEHFTSNIIRQKMAAAIDQLPRPRDRRSACIILFTPEKEFHELPLQFFHYLLRSYGYRVINLGINLATEVLFSVIQLSSPMPTHVMYYTVTNIGGVIPQEFLHLICRNASRQQVIVTGTHARLIHQVPANALVMHSLEDTLHFCKTLRKP